MSKLILSLDGGGIRGAATTQFLSRVEEKLQSKQGKSIRDYADFYAGTSTGSIIALALATTELTISQINELYNYENACKIFKENKGFLEIDGINAPKYEAKGKTQMLKDNFGKSKIKNVPKDKHVLAVTYGVETRRPIIIKSTQKEDRSLYSYEVADASSAAPTYFPTRELNKDETNFWLIDGGVTANNPTMCAIAEAKKQWSKLSIDDFRVLSIGTGSRTRKINGPDSRKWGAVQWMTKGHIIDILSDEDVVAYQTLTIMGSGKCIRVNSELKPQPGLKNAPDDAMDDISPANIEKLKKLGDFWFNQYGESVVELILNTYDGPSLGKIDPETGKPQKK